MRSTIKVNQVRYHRNGVGGEGFFAVGFTFREDGVEHRLVATVVASEGVLGEVDGLCQVYVIDPADLDSRWRGDVFAAELLTVVTAAAADGSAFREGLEANPWVGVFGRLQPVDTNPFTCAACPS